MSATSAAISIASFATFTGVPGVASESFSFAFSVTTAIVKKMLKTTLNKTKHDKIFMLARSELNSIESKIFEALINNETSHEDFATIINEEKNYLGLKESIRMMKI